MLLRHHHDNSLPVEPWHVPRRPLATLAPLPRRSGSPSMAGHHIVSAMINYRPDEMWRLWKCHRDDMGLSVWASREERITHRHLEGYGAPAACCLLKERATWAGLCWIFIKFHFYIFYYFLIWAKCAAWILSFTMESQDHLPDSFTHLFAD